MARDLKHRKEREEKEWKDLRTWGTGLSLTLMLIEACPLPHHVQSSVMSHLAIGRAPCLILLSRESPKADVHPWPRYHSQAEAELKAELGALESGGDLRGFLSTWFRLSPLCSPCTLPFPQVA